VYELDNKNNNNTFPEIFRSKFYKLCEDYTNFYRIRIYTDGSKMVKEWPRPVLHLQSLTTCHHTAC